MTRQHYDETPLFHPSQEAESRDEFNAVSGSCADFPRGLVVHRAGLAERRVRHGTGATGSGADQ